MCLILQFRTLIFVLFEPNVNPSAVNVSYDFRADNLFIVIKIKLRSVVSVLGFHPYDFSHTLDQDVFFT